jgi:hypothetical protein
VKAQTAALPGGGSGDEGQKVEEDELLLSILCATSAFSGRFGPAHGSHYF